MGKYNVYIIDPLDAIASINDPTNPGGSLVKVTEILSDWFDPIAKQNGYSEAFVCFPQYDVSPAPHELMIYVCPFGTSVVQKMPGAPRINSSTAPEMGVTVITPVLTGSEVWVKTSSLDGIAALIFHEAMHNKLQLAEKKINGKVVDLLHTKYPPPQTPCSLSCASITFVPRPAPTLLEQQDMVVALKKSVTQWSAGQAILRKAAKDRDSGDPLWNLPITA